jgi:EAL domain-containing protein (putative c-di-GMP-specific phosphodiesterase class I)
MPLDHAGWAAQLSNGLQQQQTKLAQFPLVGRENRLIHMECPLRLRFAPDEPWQAAGKFIPMAEQLGMTDRVDLESIRLGLEILQSDAHLVGVAINVSASSFSQADFVRQVLQQLDRASSCAQRLWIDVNAAGALNHLAAFKHAVSELKRTGIHLGLEHFGHQISRFGEIYGIGLDYLKIDASFIRDIDQHAGNQALLQGTVSMAHHAGLQVYAEGVKTAAEYQTVLALDVDGATGPLFSIA